ncbi:DUF1156 domain-containing protein [Halococcus sp. IIIV-5B]|uniref:DUF1156 domain-containing protein n=1 Tax=Halococcus sp. IIIV-5B TaxID=2321230 RepID=UPI000E70F6E1|nr:DUF1156 domain-containing protein [Halococcus sp. IIIV-5B]RJT07491.1 DUF1156 domain-containing protein [Halococcus sp. IIIV-5B]
MSEEIHRPNKDERTTLPIEKGFPIERVNEIAAKEGRAKMHYRPIYTMHKWWARRLGCVFRTICLYALLDNPEKVTVHEPGENGSLSDFGAGANDIQELLDTVDIADPDALWELYPKDVRIEDKKILDPFMGGGTSLVEASRFGVESVGYDLNPVAWFVTKKELEAGQTNVAELEAAFEQVKEDVAEEILDYYKTPCPNGGHDADVMYNFWVKELDCVDCGHTVPLFKDYRVAKGRYEHSEQYNVLCPDCESVVRVDDWQSESTCSECAHEFVPKEGNVNGSKYACPDCGAKYAITDAIGEQGGFDLRLYALEYYCPTCDDHGREKSAVKGYKRAENADIELFEQAREEWESSPELHEYVPNEAIPPGHMVSERNPVFDHGYEKWSDMFTIRQLLALAKLLRSIGNIKNKNAQEFLILAASESLRYTNSMVSYNTSHNKIGDFFRNNSFAPPMYPVENNVWGSVWGSGTFSAMFEMILDGVRYAHSPTERYVEDDNNAETPPFSQPIGENATIHRGDMRRIDAEDEYDAVITDPPYYDNIIYSEVADYFYVWQKILLEGEYEGFDQEKTPRAESIVTNPFLGKTSEDFESELHESFSVVHRALKDDGVLAFTYHHSDSDSWGELLESLCDVGFEVTATYPISADINKFISGEAVEFDIIIIARPADERDPISWNSLRRNIYRTAKKTRKRLEENRDLSRGDIGVVEMGRCFHEYSKHHGEVERAGEMMSAKEVVDEIYGVIQDGSDIGEIDVFLDLLEDTDPGYNDLNKLCRGTNATPERMEDMRLYRMDDGFALGTWDDERRIAYIQNRVENDEELTDLDKAQFLRYRWEHGKSVSGYLSEWDVTDDLRELCEGLADATGDNTYRNILESRLSDY